MRSTLVENSENLSITLPKTEPVSKRIETIFSISDYILQFATTNADFGKQRKKTTWTLQFAALRRQKRRIEKPILTSDT